MSKCEQKRSLNSWWMITPSSFLILRIEWNKWEFMITVNPYIYFNGNCEAAFSGWFPCVSMLFYSHLGNKELHSGKIHRTVKTFFFCPFPPKHLASAKSVSAVSWSVWLRPSGLSGGGGPRGRPCPDSRTSHSVASVFAWIFGKIGFGNLREKSTRLFPSKLELPPTGVRSLHLLVNHSNAPVRGSYYINLSSFVPKEADSKSQRRVRHMSSLTVPGN